MFGILLNGLDKLQLVLSKTLLILRLLASAEHTNTLYTNQVKIVQFDCDMLLSSICYILQMCHVLELWALRLLPSSGSLRTAFIFRIIHEVVIIASCVRVEIEVL